MISNSRRSERCHGSGSHSLTLLWWQVCFKAADANAECVLSFRRSSVSMSTRSSDGQWTFYAHAHAAYVASLFMHSFIGLALALDLF